MIRFLPILLGLFVAVAACAQETPPQTDGMKTNAAASAPSMPDTPPRANDEARLSPNAAVSQTIGTTVVTVQYGRPSVKGRSVFGEGSELAPTGQVWRTGANEATTFTVSNDVRIEGQPLPVGTYALFTLPGADAWTVVFNKTAQQWGAFRYDEGEDQLRVTVAPMDDAPMMEQLQIRFEQVSDTEATMTLHWGTVSVPITITTAS